MTRLFYTAILTLALPLLLVRLYWRARRSPDYRLRISERLGSKRWPASFARQGSTVWIHAVSVGETVAAAPLVNALQQQFPATRIIFTTMTPTGSRTVLEKYGDRVLHCYLPYDLPFLLQPLLERSNPDLLIVMETELWPNLINCCARRGTPVLLANARLSAKSASGYGRIAGLTRTMLTQITTIATQSDADAERLIALGAPEDSVVVTGSLKFNVAADARPPSAAPVFAAIAASARPVLIAASTRDKEEQHVYKAFQRALQAEPDLLLLIVPRHPERFTTVANEAIKCGLTVQRRSESEQVNNTTQVMIGDSMGEMSDYYHCAHLAFVGGSLVDTGCQNVLEPAAIGLPVLVGPSQYNFAAICAALSEAGALRTVADSVALGEAIVDLLADTETMKRMGEAGKELVAANQQALPKHLQLIARHLAKQPI